MRASMLLLFLLISSGYLTGQKKITLSDIFQSGKLRTRSVPGFNYLNDGKTYVVRNEKGIMIHELTTGSEVATYLSVEDFQRAVGESAEIEDFSFSPQENKLAIGTGLKPIYRHSNKGSYYVFDRDKKSFKSLLGGKAVSNPMFSPDGNKIAYTHENNLYYLDLITGRDIQVTQDGKWNYFINGMCDWVYEEEFGFTRAFEWSVDSRSIAFLKFDESNVPEYTIQYQRDSIYPLDYTFKYPKVGEPNAIVSVFIYNLDNGKVIAVSEPSSPDIYYPRIKWTQDPSKVCVFQMNRHQNDLKLLLADVNTGHTELLMQETNPRYIEINDHFKFLKDGKRFLWVSEGEGFTQAYLYDMKGKKLNRITDGRFDVTDILGVDEKNERVYYQQASPTPMDRQVLSVGFNGNKEINYTPYRGTSTGQFSPSFEIGMMTFSTANTPPIFKLINKKNETIRVLEDNSKAIENLKQYEYGKIEFFTFTTAEGVDLNGWILKPKHFDESKKYPLFMTLYGGPGSQSVLDAWRGGSWWLRMIAEQGYVVACVDNRGTGGRGQEFRKMTYLQLGHYETIDQIEAAKYLGTLPFIEKDRIGIFGWSYGGYMSSLCLLKGNDVFKAAIAVAPVTNWKWYDSIYTERYMRTEKENPDGYKKNSPVYFADRLKGNYFIAHGEADDNVHYQNAAEMMKELIKANKNFESHIYPNSNHGIYTDGATIHLYNRMTEFILNKI